MSEFLLLRPWHPSPTVVVLTAVAAWLFVRGVRRQRVPVVRQVSFWAGLLLLYLALHTRLDYYAEREFFVHRIQQMVLRDIGPFLLVLARPGTVLWAGIPEGVRRPLRRTASSPLARALGRGWTHPLVAGALFVGLGWWWLIPMVHFYAMLDVRLYRLMNASMVAVGLLFWSLVLDSRPSPPARVKPGFRIVLAAAVMPLEMAPGIIITFAPRNLYPLYDLCGRAFAGITAQQDQMLGGLLIWVAGSTMNVIGALTALYFALFAPAPAATDAPKPAHLAEQGCNGTGRGNPRSSL